MPINLSQLNRTLGGSRLPRRRRPWWLTVLVMSIAAGSFYAKQKGWLPQFGGQNRSTQHAPAEQKPTRVEPRGAEDARDRLSGLIRARQTTPTVVTSAGTVVKLLPDDIEGDRHQRLLVKLDSGEAVLIAHNIDLALRVPAQEGDRVGFTGEFIWNERGGVVHWTHRDPRQKHTDGWVELNGKRYE